MTRNVFFHLQKILLDNFEAGILNVACMRKINKGMKKKQVIKFGPYKATTNNPDLELAGEHANRMGNSHRLR